MFSGNQHYIIEALNRTQIVIENGLIKSITPLQIPRPQFPSNKKFNFLVILREANTKILSQIEFKNQEKSTTSLFNKLHEIKINGKYFKFQDINYEIMKIISD